MMQEQQQNMETFGVSGVRHRGRGRGRGRGSFRGSRGRNF